MGPNKAPAFAMCAGVSVETVVTSSGRRKSDGNAIKRSATAEFADSLYADLLWDCGGANVENAATAAGTFPNEDFPTDDFSDVFGGPPKFATMSSKIYCGMLATKLSRSDEVLSIECTASSPNRSEEPFCQTPLCIVQETSESLTRPPSSAKFVKIRSATEVDFPSRVCYSDSDNKGIAQQKGDKPIGGKEFSGATLSGAFARVRTASTSVRQSEPSGSVCEEMRRSSLSKPVTDDLMSMKENIEGFREAKGNEQEGKLAAVNEKQAYCLNVSNDRKQKSAHHSQPSKVQVRNLKMKVKKVCTKEPWITIRDVHCATKPSQFPPPSRPPPELRFNAMSRAQNFAEAANNMFEQQNDFGSVLQKRASFDSGSVSLYNASELKPPSDSRNIEDAVGIAEAKVKMVLEAREKAKLMVEKKFREKRRAQELKEKLARDGKSGKVVEDGNKSANARHQQCDINKFQEELLRRRDILNQCIEKVTQDMPNDSVLSVQDRVSELRLSPEAPENSKDLKGQTAKMDLKREAVQLEPKFMASYLHTEASGGYHKVPYDGGRSESVGEELINEPRQPQQDCLSSAWSPTYQKEFNKKVNSEKLLSTSSSHDTTTILSGNESSTVCFHPTTGESLNRHLARLDRHCRTAARMEKALEEKRQRDLDHQKEQAERQRAAEMLDDEIRIWAAGKEGNLEALLCSLHLVLWPECGWEGVSPADLSNIDAVKKAYRRATLVVHPDKVQQRGATVTQKYVAEKVFDLLREASTTYK